MALNDSIKNSNFGVYRQTSTSIEGLEGIVDFYPEEFHTWSATTTNFPVERGTDLTDNAYVKPQELTVRAIVSAILPSDNSKVQIDPVGRAEEAWARIRDFANKLEVTTVVTLLGTYEDMMILNMNPVVTVENGRSLVLDITMKQVLFADTETAKLPASKVGSSSTSSAGTTSTSQSPVANKTSTVQGGQKASPESSTTSKSSLSSLFGD